MGAVFEGGNYKNLTASGQVTSGPGTMLGFYVNSTSTGVIQFKDGGATGTDMSGAITPAVGFHRFPATFGVSGLYFVKASGTIDITIFYAPA